VARSLSSQKAIRRSQKRAQRNKARRSQVKTSIRKVNDAMTARDPDAAEKAFREAVRVLDCSATRRTIHPNTAARRKSQLAKRLNAIKTAKSRG